MTRRQITLAGTGFEKYTKTTRRAQFLAEMDRAVPTANRKGTWTRSWCFRR